MRSNCWRSG